MPNYKITIEQVDELLPQTQCGECGYGGCLPYAKAIVNFDEQINRCPPGGVITLKKLGQLLEQDVTGMLDDMATHEKPAFVARIREAECIGCTKCLAACPVDVIIGAPKQMHTILASECTGCGLCLPPCPVDCIEMVEIPQFTYNKTAARARFEAKNRRHKQVQKIKNERLAPTLTTGEIHDPNNKKAEIRAAVLRAKARRSHEQSNDKKDF